MPVINQGLLGSKYMNMMPTLGAGAWSPANLSPTQLLQWLDATDESTITLNGSDVSNWNDKSGNAKHASQVTAANQPTYETGEALNYIDYPLLGVNYLTSPSVTNVDGVHSFLIFKTAHQSEDLIHATFRFAFRLWNGSAGSFASDSYDSVYKNGNLVTVTTGDEGYDTFGTDEIVMGEIRGYDYSDAVWLNNDWNYGSTGGGFQYEGRLYEVIHLAPDTPLADIQRMEGYLAHKYGLEANLPPAHPYKDSAPVAADPEYTPFNDGANVILDFQIESSVTLNGTDISEVANQASTEIGDFEQTNAVQQPLYNTSDSDAGGFKTMDTDDGVSTKQGLECQDSITFGDIYFAMTYKDGTDSTFDSFSNLISDPATVGNRILGNNGTADLFTGTVFTSELEIDGAAASNEVLPMPFSIIRASNATAGTGELDLFFVESSGSRDWEGSLAYFATFPEQLTQYKSDKVVGYMSHKFNLTDELPLGHPYKTTAPKLATQFEAFTDAVTWFNAADADSVTLNGSDVASIQDYSRYDLNFAQATAANQPAYDSTNGQIDFDGSNKFLTVGDTSTYQFLHEKGGTIAVRFKLSSSDSGTLQVLFATAHLTSGDTGVSLAIDDRNTSDNRLYFNVGKSVAGTLCYKTFNLSAFDIGNVSDQFQTIVVTYDNVSADLYADGVLLASQNILSALGTGSQSRIARVGTEASGAFDLDGSISRLYIGDRKLSQAEVTSLTNKLNS